jgi:uncharacterized membrane protein required for colicin V production
LNWLDLLILVIVGFSAVLGLRRGLLVSLTKTVGFLIGLFIAFSFYRQMADYLSAHIPISDWIAPVTVPLIERWNPVAEILPMAPDYQLGEYVNKIITLNIISCLSFLLILFLTVFLFGLVGGILSSLLSFTPFGPINRLGGLFFGLMIGALYVVVLLMIMAPFQNINLSLAGSGMAFGSVFPPGSAFADSTLLRHFQPLLDLLTLKASQSIPLIDIRYDSLMDRRI